MFFIHFKSSKKWILLLLVLAGYFLLNYMILIGLMFWYVVVNDESSCIGQGLTLYGCILQEVLANNKLGDVFWPPHPMTWLTPFVALGWCIIAVTESLGGRGKQFGEAFWLLAGVGVLVMVSMIGLVYWLRKWIKKRRK